MNRSTARIETGYASRYLQQLCKHFAHRIPVEFSKTDGRMAFEDNECLLRAEGDVLTITIRAADPPTADRLQDVVVRHLERLAFQDRPEVTWVAA